MSEFNNPFEYDAAANLPLEVIEKVYIEDHNYSRFILSNRNIYLLGERGSGKSMMLIYNSFKLKSVIAEHAGTQLNSNFIGIHVPCKRPLFNKTEYELLEDTNLAALLSEHYFVLVILHSLGGELEASKTINEQLLQSDFYSDFEYIIGEQLPRKDNCFTALKMFAQKQLNHIEQVQSDIEKTLVQTTFYSFHSLVIPVLELIKSCDALSSSHFMIMIDDAHDLNEFQIKKINSWVSYRDHSLFSMKVATADVYKHDMQTDFGGCIVEGHDFMSINMEKNLQGANSPFNKLAKDIIERRLSFFVPNVTAEEFFPTNPKLVSDIEKCRLKISKTFDDENPNATAKQKNDYLYKKTRVAYFRNRATKANRPPYSGFDILVHASTGVIRNLLAPCYAMYDLAYSESQKTPDHITPKIQQDILMEQSEKLWTQLRTKKLSNELIECTEQQAASIHNFFECLGDLFTERLKTHDSEPRIITFTISGMTDEYRAMIEPAFNIARKALLLYERSGPAKDSGRRETYYVPNRMLWIARGLDPVGQHGRVSLPAKAIIASFEGKTFPYIEHNSSLGTQQEIGF